MKKSIFIFIIILSFFVNSLIAQNVSIGIKDGLSWSTINGSYYFHDRKVAEISKIKGRNFGILINFPINKFVSLQTELNYKKKGFEFNSNNSNMCGPGYSGNYNLTYLVTPLLINYELGKSIKYYGYVGASFGFLLKADNQATFVSSVYPPLRYDYNDNVMNKFNNSEIGAILGFGFKIPLCNNVNILLDARYDLGLTKSAINGKSNNYLTSEVYDYFTNVYNRSFSINWGIIYNFKNKIINK